MKKPKRRKLPTSVQVIQLQVIKGRNSNRFSYRGLVFDRIYSGCFESRLTEWSVPVQIFRPLGMVFDNTLGAWDAPWKIKWFGGHDGCHRLVPNKAESGDEMIDAKYFKSGDVLLISGFKNRITRQYIKDQAEVGRKAV